MFLTVALASCAANPDRVVQVGVAPSTPPPSPTAPAPSVGTPSSGGIAAPTTPTAPAPTTPAPTIPTTATTAAVVDRRLFLLGDSVMLSFSPRYTDAARQVLGQAGWEVTLDTKGSRRADAALQVVRQRRAEIGEAVAIQLGNNYLGNAADFRAAMEGILATLDGVDRIVLLTVSETQSNRRDVNAVIRSLADQHPGARLVDWAAMTAEDDSLTQPDGLHLTAQGARFMALLIADALGPPPGAT